MAKNLLYGLLLMGILGSCNRQKSPVLSEPQAGADKYMAFTFDDGPSEKTEPLLAVLKENNISATFFLIGQNIRSRPQDAERIFAEGHEIGNHSDGYAGLGVNGDAGESAIRESLAATTTAIREITGTDPVYFRAPNLDYSDTLTEIVQEMNMALIGTDVIGYDWETGITTEEIIEKVLSAAKDGGIILLHERHEGDLERTIRAIPVIAQKLRAGGYEFFTVSELARKKGMNFEAGTRYDTIEK